MSDPEGLVTFEAGGQTYTAVFGFRAMKAVEHYYDLPFFRAIQKAMPRLEDEADLGDKQKLAQASADLRFEDIGKLFQFALMKHQPDISEEDIDDIVDEIGLGETASVIGQALTAALVKEGDAGSSPNPPKASRKR